ncbi:MAG: hypothetical protein K8S99_06505 [Planctomycetes bacterium]|nr:hypothetical protein [Planctomycetota bacterium]
MQACATLPISPETTTITDPEPMVLVDGLPEPALRVVEWSIDDALDRRSARVALAGPNAPEARSLCRDGWTQAGVIVAMPLRLSDESVRWLPLCAGLLETSDEGRAAGTDGWRLTLSDDWSRRLADPLPSAWRETETGAAVETHPLGVMRVGIDGNRSLQRHTINDRPVYALREGGGAWTVRDALESLAAFAGFDLITRGLPVDVARSPLVHEIDLGKPLGDALTGIMEPYGLSIRRELRFNAGDLSETIAVIALGDGATIRPVWPSTSRRLGDVLSVRAVSPSPRARLWTAEARGAVVESTFNLLQGWNPALEGLPDDDYRRSGNPHFADVANVYRLWALNEDGRFTPPPFERGPAFDLPGLFGDESLTGWRGALRFDSCLTLDDAGRRRAAIVEISLDAGSSWSHYPGRFVLRGDSASVYFDDATLPPGFFTAAKTHDVLVRVTASLQSPVPLRATRWRGNPSIGADAPRTIDLGDAFSVRRVAATSIHRAGIDAGTLIAPEIDQRPALFAWLVQRISRERSDGGDGLATVELSGAWPALRVGDRVIGGVEPPLDPEHPAERLGITGGVVRSLRVAWRRNPSRATPVTRIELSPA